MYQIAIEKDKALKIMQDEHAESPREFCEEFTHMISWHRNYKLGDEHNYDDPRDLLVELAKQFVSTPKAQEVIKKYAQEVSDRYTIEYDQEEEGYVISTEEWFNPFSRDIYETQEEAQEAINERGQEFIDDPDWDEFSWDDLETMFEDEVVMLPIYAYEHGGITISTGGFSCSWDSGQVGWIYATKDEFRKETGYNEFQLFGTNKNKHPEVGDLVILRGFKEDEPRYIRWVKVKEVLEDGVMVDLRHGYAGDRQIVFHKFEDIEENVCGRAKEMLESQIEVYDQYLQGEVYGFWTMKCVDPDGLDNYMKRNDIEDYNDLPSEAVDVFYEHEDSCWGFYGDNFEESGMMGDISKEYRHLFDKLSDWRYK